jgi:protein SCO1/2
MRRAFQITSGVLLGLVVTSAIVWQWTRSAESDLAASHFLPSAIPAPDLPLRTHLGEQVSLSELNDLILVIFFGYTHCPDVCPTTMAVITRALDRLAARATSFQPIFVTVDPVRDTRERLDTFLRSFHPSFLALTGSEEEIRAVADAYGVFFAKAGEGEDYLVDHSARTFVVDRDGQIGLTFPAFVTTEDVVRDLTALLEEG